MLLRLHLAVSMLFVSLVAISKPLIGVENQPPSSAKAESIKVATENKKAKKRDNQKNKKPTAKQQVKDAKNTSTAKKDPPRDPGFSKYGSKSVSVARQK